MLHNFAGVWIDTGCIVYANWLPAAEGGGEEKLAMTLLIGNEVRELMLGETIGEAFCAWAAHNEMVEREREEKGLARLRLPVAV